MKKIALLILCLILSVMSVFAQTGSYTSHDIFYLPLYGAYGTDEYDQYNTYMEIADQLIWDNKTAIEAIEADYLVSADLTDYYTKLEIDAFGYISDLSGFDTDDLVEGSVNKYFPGFTSLLADYGFTDNSTEWDTAYGWGDWSGEGFITGVAWGDITGTLSNQTDLNTALGNKLENITGESIGDLSDVSNVTPSDGHVLIYDGTVDNRYENRALVEADISDFGTYLTDITSESFADLSDIPAHPGVATKILETTADGYQYIDTPSGGAGASQLSDLSDVNTSTPTDKYVLIADGVDFESRQLTSDDLSDVASLARVDESEDITGWWTFKSGLLWITKESDYALSPATIELRKSRDGDPTYDVSVNDQVGLFNFNAVHSSELESIAQIRAVCDSGTFGSTSFPGRLEFATTPDGSTTPVTRMAIDNAGNIKMGDGAWTNYVNITNAGVLTLEGTANIEGVDATEFGYLDGVTSDIQTQLDAKVDDSLTADIDMNEHNIQFDSTLTADHSYSGITDVVTVGESVVFGDVLYLDATAAEWKKANAAGTGTYPGLVIALESKGDGQACKVLRMGYIRDDSWSWTVGAILLLGETAGALTATVPSDSGDMVQRLGYAIHADKIYFMPSIDIGEI